MTATTAPQAPADPAAEPIRPAATVILWRDGAQGREILMGQRGAGAVFMPSKYVFPGGGVDRGEPPCTLMMGAGRSSLA